MGVPRRARLTVTFALVVAEAQRWRAYLAISTAVAQR